MDDGRPAPAPASEVIEAKPTMARIAVIAGGVLAAVAAVVGVVLWATGGSGLGFVLPRLLGTLLLLPAAGFAMGLLTSGSATITERVVGWTNPTIEFTPWPPQLGRTMTVVYRRGAISAGARRRLRQPLQLEAELVCEEWVEYTVGTDTRTETADVVTRRLTAPTTPTADGVEATLTVTIPADAGGPTIELDHNRIRWRLDSRLGTPFGPRTTARIDLPVVPVLDIDSLIGEGNGGGLGGDPHPGMDR